VIKMAAFVMISQINLIWDELANKTKNTVNLLH